MKIKRTITVFILIGLFVAWGTGCKDSPTPATMLSPLLQSAPGISPLSTAAPDAFVVEETSPVTLPTPVVFPTSQPGFATVGGVLPKAYLERIAPNYATIYLGEWIETTDPKYPVVGLEKGISPKALFDTQTGEFFFYDVPSGEYGVLIERPLSVPVLFNDPKTGQTLYLKLEPGDIVDLGRVVLSGEN